MLLRVSGGGPRESRFQLHPAEETLSLLARDLTLPDLVAGEPCDAWGAAPIVNLTGRDIRGAELEFGDGALIEKVSVPIPPLPPEGILKVPFRVKTAPISVTALPVRRRMNDGAARSGFRFTPRGRHPGGPGTRRSRARSAFPCSLRVRPKGASRIVTFLSAQDGSVQKYAVLPPSTITAATGVGTSREPEDSESPASRGDGSGSGADAARLRPDPFAPRGQRRAATAGRFVLAKGLGLRRRADESPPVRLRLAGLGKSERDRDARRCDSPVPDRHGPRPLDRPLDGRAWDLARRTGACRPIRRAGAQRGLGELRLLHALHPQARCRDGRAFAPRDLGAGDGARQSALLPAQRPRDASYSFFTARRTTTSRSFRGACSRRGRARKARASSIARCRG